MSKQNLILPKGVEQPPEWFSENESKYYKYYFDKLEKLDLHGGVDSQAIVGLAIITSLRDEMIKSIKDEGLTFKSTSDRNGDQFKDHPLITKLAKVISDIAAREKDYGLTPKTQGGRPKQVTDDGNQWGESPMKVAK